MPTPPVSEDQTPATESASPPVTTSPPGSSGSAASWQALTSLAAVGLLVSFFLPWINFLGAKLNGMDIQKNFSSYKLVWIMPLLAIIALLMNIGKLPARSMSQIAGLSPFAILLYAAYRLEANVADLSKVLEFGAWVALICGLVLVVVPRTTKKPSTLADRV